MEEHLGNVPGCRQIFERWMQWEPDHQGWMAYIRVRDEFWLASSRINSHFLLETLPLDVL